MESRAGRGHRRATARSTRCAARPTCTLDPRQPRPLASPSSWPSAAGAPLYAPAARAEEKMVPTIEGEFAPQTADDGRRSGTSSSAKGCSRRAATGRSTPSRSPRTGCCATSPRCLHLVALGRTSCCSASGWVYAVTLALQLRAPARGALLGRSVPVRPFSVARYYVLLTASIAAGLWDWLRHGHGGRWEKAEGTR